jgi:hypothetical protein
MVQNYFLMSVQTPILGAVFQHINILILKGKRDRSMASETDYSTCNHLEGSTPSLSVSIPGGLAISLLGVFIETGPICFNVNKDGPNPLLLPVEYKAADGFRTESPGTLAPVSTGNPGIASDGSFKKKLIPVRRGTNACGEPKMQKLSKHPKPPKRLKHPKPPKLPKPLKHPKPPMPPKPLKHPKPPMPPKPLKHPKPLKPPKPLKHPKPPMLPKPLKHPKPPMPPKPYDVKSGKR